MKIEPLDDPPPNLQTQSFLDRLTLRRVDRDIFTGWCHAGGPLRAFGGQVAAQALIAAGSTVDDPARRVHSLHSYFLRPGSTDEHIVYQVDRPRDGRSFTTRRVVAVQRGETIFTMSASFATAQEGPHHQAKRHPNGGNRLEWIESIPHPDTLSEVELPHAEAHDAAKATSLLNDGFPEHRLVDLRFVDNEIVYEISRGRFDRMAWVRTREQLPDDDLVHVCAITYFSDLSLVGTVMHPHGGRDQLGHLESASLDHAMWFHRRSRADRWLLFATDSPYAGDGHGLARGEFFQQNGDLVASAVQEVLLRVPFNKAQADAAQFSQPEPTTEESQ